MLKGLVMDENISNLTFASGEVSASSGSRIETGALHPQHSFDSTNQPPPKKKKSFPGDPDPDAEVIALSPNSLQTTNRFICEICNKGFKRDQNLQLHRRGHNLPWKLKQRSNKEVKKKVYVCPEVTCVHHDPSRALGDLTGIKKHFSRKHGEKKWKCEKCSKRYAVQSDWKAHSRICGTREYRCDCGTLFSRRDSFITHRAFCDALAEESVRAIAVNPILSSQQPGSSSSHLINLQALAVKREQDENQHLLNPRPEYSIPPWLVFPPIGEAGAGPPQIIPTSQLFPENFDHSFLQHGNPSTNPTVLPPFQYSSTATPHMSATALLQRAAQMGVTMSKPSPSPAAIPRPHQGHMSNKNPGFSSTLPATSTASSGLFLSSREEMGGEFGHGLVSLENKGSAVTSGIMEHLAASDAGGGHSLEHDMMSFLSSASRFVDGSSFDSEDFNGMLIPKRDGGNFQGILSKSTESQFRRTDHDVRTSTAGSPRGGGSDGLTRDFLGLKAFPHKDWLDHINPSTYGQRNQNQPPPWQG